MPPKAKLLLWFVFQGRLSIKDKLRRLNVLRSKDFRCVLFQRAEENLPHLLYTCDFFGGFGVLVAAGGVLTGSFLRIL